MDGLIRRGACGLALIVAGAAPVAGQDAVAPSTREMGRLLRERAAQVDPAKLPYIVNDRRADWLAGRLAGTVDPVRRSSLRFDYATELVNAGRIPEAIEALGVLRSEAEGLGPAVWQRVAPLLLNLGAVAWLRLAEERNCHMGNAAQSCLLPIRGRGIHRDREGSTRAVQVLDELLSIAPDNLRARWLLNLAHMTLGQYPEGVPPPFLIPPDRFASDYPLPRFPNVARQRGLDLYQLSGGAILEDFDGDGWLDLMVSSMGLEDPLRYFRNTGGGHFEERTAEAGLTGELGGLNLLQADYDGDGFVDALVLRGGWLGSEGRFPLSLLRNDGDGTFTDVTVEAGLLRDGPTQTAVWLDYDGDGRLDLYVGNETTSANELHPCELFRNLGGGRFEEVGAEAGVDAIGFVKAVVSGDYDDDGRPDLYLSLGGGNNLLFHNDGPRPGGGWAFSERAAAAGVAEPFVSFPAFFFDYDNDGHQDLFVAGYGAMAEDVAADYLGLPWVTRQAGHSRLYRNRGDGTFEDATRQVGLDRAIVGMGINYGDLDSDGWLDFYVGTGNPDLSTLVPNRMFRNDAGRSFQDVTTAGDFGNLQKGHAICFGDVDNDGDEDVFEEMGGAVASDRAYSTLFQNPGHGHRWLGLMLEGARSNRFAVGARVEVVVETGQGERSLFRSVGSGGSFGASPLRLHVGLGDARRVLRVRVRWPRADGRLEEYAGMEAGRWYRLREGTPGATAVDLPRGGA